MYSATIDLVAECQKWLRNVAYVKTDGQTGGVAISPVPGPTAPAGDNKNIQRTIMISSFMSCNSRGTSHELCQ